MKVGLYSITYLGLWYKGPALTLEQTIDRARAFGYDGVEIDGKRPHGNPLDLPRARCLEVRQKAADAGIEIYAVAANNDFSSPIPEHRESQLLYTRELIRATADLGATVLRVFPAWSGVTPRPGGGGRYDAARRVWHLTQQESSADETWERVRDGLIESARWAGELGVTLALQNHLPVIHHYEDMLRFIHEVGSPHLKACFDAPLAAKQGVTSMRKAVADVGPLQVLSHFGGEYDTNAAGGVEGFVRNADGTLSRDTYSLDFTLGLVENGYRGYVGYELCHPLPKVDGQLAGIEFADKNARLAAQYMRGLIAEATRMVAQTVGADVRA